MESIKSRVKSWPYSTSVFHAVLQNLQTLNSLYISHFLTLFHIGSKTLYSSWEGGRITPRKRKRRILAVSYDLKYWGWLVISHLGLPNQEAYGFRPPTHPPPTPGAPKDHPSSTKIARCRYPHGGGAESVSIRKPVMGIVIPRTQIFTLNEHDIAIFSCIILDWIFYFTSSIVSYRVDLFSYHGDVSITLIAVFRFYRCTNIGFRYMIDLI